MLRNISLKLPKTSVDIKVFSANLTHSSAEYINEDRYKLLSKEHITEAVKLSPALSMVSSEMWRTAHQTFLNHGLSTQNFLQIATGNPKVLMRSPMKVIEALEFWRTCQFGEYCLFLLITKYPELLDVNDQQKLLKHISFLKSYVNTDKNVWKLLMTCPSLMQDSVKNIEARMSYFKNVMCLEIPEIIKSKALTKPLEEIKCRHIFLERLRLFRPRPKKVDPNQHTDNPRLYKITDTSDKTFATKICHVTAEEYESFKILFRREIERKEEETENKELLSDDDDN
uniref:mTERF domain-containing protein 2 n=1 Tax=Glossina morsitans morsitans TaxID=37546 RepID=A0A1B0F9I8_GLOMM